jgi:hypothetical protein
MERSENFNFYLPSRDADDVADINQISENFRVIDAGVVKKVSGKGLSSNDYTDEEKNKLAKVNPEIDQVFDAESENPQSGKAVAETINKDWLESDETSFAYIKNRTHYVATGELALTVAESGEFEPITNEQKQLLVSMLKNSTTTVVDADNGHIVYNDITVQRSAPNEIDFYEHIVGALLDGGQYTIMVFGSADDVIATNPVMGVGYATLDGEITLSIHPWDFATAGGVVTFSGITELKKLDEKYLPDTVAKKSEVGTALGLLDDRVSEIEAEIDGIETLLEGI